MRLPLFRRLSENFELCVFVLDLVKQDPETFQRDYYHRFKDSLENETPIVQAVVAALGLLISQTSATLTCHSQPALALC